MDYLNKLLKDTRFLKMYLRIETSEDFSFYGIVVGDGETLLRSGKCTSISDVLESLEKQARNLLE